MKRLAALALALMVAGCGDGRRTSRDEAGNGAAAATMAAAPTATPVPADSKARLAAAIHAAFPNGTLAGFDDQGSEELFDEHKLVDAPSGPVLVSIGHVPDASHGEAGMVAVRYLVAQGSGFRAQPGAPRTWRLGSHGGLSEWAVSDKFLDVPVVYASGGGTFQGYTCGSALLVALTPQGAVAVASIPENYDDSGAVTGEDGQKPVMIEGKIGNIVKGRGFTMHYSGTSRFDEHYRWQSGKFTLRGGETKIPQC